MSNSNRVQALDMVRGVTILLVVSFHAGLPESLNYYLMPFRMPLFFLVSGYLFSSKYIGNLHILLKRKFRSLIIPYFSVGIITIIFCSILRQIGSNSPSLQNLIFGILYGNGIGKFLFNYPTWFLVTLFLAVIIFSSLLVYFNKLNLILQVFVFIIIGIIGIALGRFVHLPWGLDIALAVQPFLLFGFKLKEFNILNKRLFKSNYSLAVLLISYLIIINYNGPIDINNRIYSNIFLYYLGGITGGLVILKFCDFMELIRPVVSLLTYLGRESQIILIFHVLFGFFTAKLFMINHWILVTVISIVVCLLASYIIKRFSVLNILLNGKELDNKKERKSKLMRVS